MNTKQVIVMRKDLKMRKGKIAAQSSHATMSFLTRDILLITSPMREETNLKNPLYVTFYQVMEKDHTGEIKHWLENSFRKICVYVNSEEELLAVHQKALDNGLVSHIIEDNGKTEFNGVKTLTCCAIGPHWDERFVGITDHLPLF